MTAVTRDGGGDTRLLKCSRCLRQHLSVSQSQIFRRPGWEAVLEKSAAVALGIFEVPKSLCFVPQDRRGGLGLSPEGTGNPVSFLHAGLGVSISQVVVKQEQI